MDLSYEGRILWISTVAILSLVVALFLFNASTVFMVLVGKNILEPISVCLIVVFETGVWFRLHQIDEDIEKLMQTILLLLRLVYFEVLLVWSTTKNTVWIGRHAKFVVKDPGDIIRTLEPFLNEVAGNGAKMVGGVGTCEAFLLYWESIPTNNVGHLSLLLVNHTFISGWPLWDEDTDKTSALFKPTTRYMNRTLSDDIQGEGKYPDYVVLLPPDLKLDYEEMVEEWVRLQSTPYKLGMNNCAHTVWLVLEAGGLRIRNVMGDFGRLGWLYHAPSSLVRAVIYVIMAKSQMGRCRGRILFMAVIMCIDYTFCLIIIVTAETLLTFHRCGTRADPFVSAEFKEWVRKPLWWYHLVKAIGVCFTGETSRVEYVAVTGLVYLLTFVFNCMCSSTER